MTGHQAEFWHAGILAKYLAADTAARVHGAEAAWVWVDQDRPAMAEVRYPARVNGSLHAKRVAFAPGRVPPVPEDAAAPFVQEGLAAIRGAMERAQGAPTFARQVGGAIGELIAPLLHSGRAPVPIYATELARTDLFREVVERMRRDPEGCARTYNAAAARHPSAGMRALTSDDVQFRYELPLWHLPPSGVRRRVYAEMLEEAPIAELAPRALLMTGLLRLAACDLFVHGTGGGGSGDGGDGEPEGYDRVTDEWLGEWMGLAPGELAPIAVVTATRFLPLAAEPPPTDESVAQAVWQAHHARHEPALLGETEEARRKQQQAEAIRREHDRRTRAELYRAMHDGLDGVRARHAIELVAMDERASDLASRLGDAELANDRTWAFPLFPATTLTALREEIGRAFNAARPVVR